MNLINERDLFLEALNIERGERAAFLERSCRDNSALRERVEELLRCHESDSSVLERWPAEFLVASGSNAETAPPVAGPRMEAIGTVIAGRYTLLERIGEGGMGTVYRAKQTEPVKRDVAIKVIKAGVASKDAFLRFEAERQALACMNHPNIARVYDGGTTPSGQPYFVMDFVQGVPITQFCDERRLNPQARLELMVGVCQAVQHAHQKGIIHRDLKPGNILVTEVDGRPTPTVIDFGVAKATEQRLTEQTIEDGEAIVGTLEYMSPEQADPTSEDVDTRADVYALGIILYELLVGSTPINSAQLNRGAVLEMLRILREVEPPRPSTRLQASNTLPTIAASRSVEPARLATMLRGELDWVVMKSLEKDRSRRYESANDLAKDVRRYLTGEPVLAVPPSRRYRLRKFVRRNPAPVLATTLVISALVTAIIGTSWGMVKAQQARNAEREQRLKADQAADKERAANEVSAKRLVQIEKGIELLGSIFEDLNPGRAEREGKPLPLLLGERVDQATHELENATGSDPMTLARLQNILGQSQLGLGNSDKAIALFAKTRATYVEQLGSEHPDTLTATGNLAIGYRAARRFDEALPLLLETFEIRKKTLGPDHIDTLNSMNNLALIYKDTGKIELALPLYEQTAKLTEAKLGPDDPRTLMCLSNLAAGYFSAGKRDLALPLMEQSLKKRRETLGTTNPDTLTSMNNLAVVYQAMGRLDLAMPLLEETFALTRDKLGADHIATLESMHNLAAGLHASRKPDEAIALLEELLRREKLKFGPIHRQTLKTMNDLADAYNSVQKPEKAAPLYEELRKWQSGK